MPMTAKQVFKNTLIELNKINAPALKLYEFNHFINKAISQYENMVYNIYETNQQTIDDLRVLQSSVYLTPTKVKDSDKVALNGDYWGASKYASRMGLYGNTYECWLPMDYMHILNCVCTFDTSIGKKCLDNSTYIQRPATRLTTDSWPHVMNDFYNRPSMDRPYYMVYNQNRKVGSDLPMDPVRKELGEGPGKNPYIGTDINGPYGRGLYDPDKLADNMPGSNNIRTFTFYNGHKESLVERSAAQRIGNVSSIRLEIRCGRADPNVILKEVQVDYLRVPQYVLLTQEQLDLTQDTSQMMEFPDYVCQEIINILVRLIMERSNDPRLGNNLQINQTIARPNAQQ